MSTVFNQKIESETSNTKATLTQQLMKDLDSKINTETDTMNTTILKKLNNDIDLKIEILTNVLDSVNTEQREV